MLKNYYAHWKMKINQMFWFDTIFQYKFWRLFYSYDVRGEEYWKVERSIHVLNSAEIYVI